MHIFTIITKTTDESQTSTDESQTTTDESQMTTDESQTSTDKSQTSRDESQTTTDESQISHGRLRQIIPKVFFNTFIKHYFQKGYGFQMPPMKRWFLLKKGKFKI